MFLLPSKAKRCIRWFSVFLLYHFTFFIALHLFLSPRFSSQIYLKLKYFFFQRDVFSVTSNCNCNLHGKHSIFDSHGIHWRTKDANIWNQNEGNIKRKRELTKEKEIATDTVLFISFSCSIETLNAKWKTQNTYTLSCAYQFIKKINAKKKIK